MDMVHSLPLTYDKLMRAMPKGRKLKRCRDNEEPKNGMALDVQVLHRAVNQRACEQDADHLV